MKKRLMTFVLGVSTLLFSTSYAAPNLVMKLNKINFQIDRAEIFAANCAVEAKESQTVSFNCSQASDILNKLNRKLDQLEKLNPGDNDQIAQNIRQLRSKIDQVHQELKDAEVATGNYKLNSPLDAQTSVNN